MQLPILSTPPLRGIFAILLIAALPFLGPGAFAEEPGEGPSIFLIGNSLTWDTVPSLLEGDVQWHVDCGKSLPFMVQNPAEPCVKSSTLWPEALAAKQYDMISLQVHYGSTLDEDLAVIAALIDMQPEAEVVIHTGWARSASRAEEYASTATTGPMTHSPAYFESLLGRLSAVYPDRVFRLSRAQELLETVAADVAAGEAPFDAVEDLYRDAIHMNRVTGRYLMHNAMRRAFGLPRSTEGFDQLPPETQSYLDGVLDRLEG